ncbi:MAG: PAS domain S-box protein, partial [Methanomassiliicoccales archaeon]
MMSKKNIGKDIQSIEKLEEIEEKYRILFQKSPASVTLLDKSGKVIDCNESTEHLTGYSRDEIIGRNFSKLSTLDTEVMSQMKRVHQKHQKGEEVEPFELEIIRKDGERRWIEVISSLQVKNGEVAGIHIISNDITKQKEAKQKLLESEEKYHNLFNKSNDAIFIHDLEGNILDVNSRALDYLGYSMDEVMKLNIRDLHPPHALKASGEAFETISKEGVVNFEIDFKKKNGDVFLAEVSSSLFEIGGKKVIQGIVRDISERRKAEEAIREGENKWRSLIDNTSDFILIVDKKGTIEFINRTLPDLEMNDVIGKKIYDFQPPESQKIHKAMLKKIFKTGNFETFQATSTGPEGDLAWYETKAVPIKKEGQVTSVMLLGSDITERKKAEMALKESEEKYRHIVENSNDLIMLTKPDGIISYLSPACESVLGYAPEDLIGKQPWIFHPDDMEMVKGVHFQALQGKSGSNFEYRVITKSGKTKWISHSWSPIIDENELQLIVSVVRDITEHRQAQLILQESEEKYRSLVEEINEVIFSVDKDGMITYISPAVESLSGYSVADIVGKPFSYFIYKEDLARVMEEFQDTLFSQLQPREYRCVKKTGEIFWIRSFNKPIIEDGNIVGARGLLTDITHQKEAEEALRQSEEKFRKFFENEPDYCYMVSPTGVILDVNKSALKAMGYAREEMVGKPIGFIYAPQTIQRMEELFNNWKKTGSLKNEEMTVLTNKGKTLSVLLSADAVRGSDDEILYSVSVQRDITDRKIMEDVLKRSEAKYRSLVEKAGAGIAISDVEGDLAYVNDALCKMIGFSEEELIGKPFIDFIHPEDMGNILRIFESAFDDPYKEVSLEFRIIHKDGHDVYLYTKPTAMLYGDMIAGFNAIITDITERKLAEKAIARRNEELSVLNMISGATNQTLELDKVLNFALEETMSVLGAGGGLITLFDDETQTFVPVIWEGFSQEIIKEEVGFKIGEGISGQTARLGIPLLVPDLNLDKSDVSHIAVKEGWQSLVSVPLKSKDEIIGVMTVLSREKERFKPEDMEVIGAIGNQIGMAIQNAHLYEESQREITERMSVEEALRYRLDFENIISSISTDFINLSTE